MDGLIAPPMGVVPPERPYMGARSKHSAGTRAPVKYIDSHVITCVPYEQKQESLSLAVKRMDKNGGFPEATTRAS